MDTPQTPSPVPTKSPTPWWAIPLAIVLAGAIVAGALIYTKRTENSVQHLGKQMAALDTVSAIRPDDHVRGSPNARIVVIEYSDSECPFCKAFHPEMKEMMEGPFGTQGIVAWVYRHYPFHPNAPKEAAASECAAELYGADAFWKYTDALFEAKAPNALLGEKTLDSVAEGLGYDPKAMNECIDSGRMTERVTKDYVSGKKAGVTATPTSIYVYKGAVQTIQPGVMSTRTIESIVSEILREHEAPAQ